VGSLSSSGAALTVPIPLAGGKLPHFAGFTAGRGVSEEVQQGRGAKIVAHNKYRVGKLRRQKKVEMWLKYSARFKGRKRNVFAIARRAVMKALKNKYRSRYVLKRDMRKIWMYRLRSLCHLHGVRYPRLINRLRISNCALNRKMLSQLGVFDRAVFSTIMDVTFDQWRDRLAKRSQPQKTYSVEQIDNLVLPFIERQLPEVYTDTNVRFNRKAADHGAVEYTVDFGDPEMWREYLPQTPELANFNIPDHWVEDANRGMDEHLLEYLEFPGEKNNNEDYISVAKNIKMSEEQEAQKKEQGEANRLSREGSREDWFEEEQQSWFDN
jgi:large subunit ribosomal protein L20